MTQTTMTQAVGWLTEIADAAAENSASADTIGDWLDRVDAQWTFKVDAQGNFKGAIVTAAYCPLVTVDTSKGIVRAQCTSARTKAVAGKKLNPGTCEQLQEYFRTLFEISA